MREKFQSKKTVNVFEKVNTVPKATKLYNSISFFVSLIYTFSLTGNTLVYTPIRSTNGEKYFNHIIYEAKCLHWLELNTSLSISSFIARVRSIFRWNNFGSKPLEMDIKVVISAPAEKKITQSKKNKQVIPKGKIIKHASKRNEIH